MTTTQLLEDVTIRTIVGNSTTEYHISGTLDAVTDAVADLFRRYNPHGYGTYLHQMSMDIDGQYFARASRRNSCE